MTHDQLQAACFQWFWNSYPALRRTMFHPQNESRPYPGESSSAYKMRLSLNRAIGIVSGVLDLIWYYQGKLYCFDIKVGHDRLSSNQLDFIAVIQSQGGESHEINTLEQFQTIVKKILIS